LRRTKEDHLQRKRDIIEKRKQFTKSNTLRCSVYKKFGHNSRSHREGGVLQIRRGKDKLTHPPRKTLGQKKKVGRPPTGQPKPKTRGNLTMQHLRVANYLPVFVFVMLIFLNFFLLFSIWFFGAVNSSSLEEVKEVQLVRILHMLLGGTEDQCSNSF